MKTITFTGIFLLLTLAVYPQLNYLDNYLTAPVTLTQIGSSFPNSVYDPRDLDFKPNSNELWVCNKGTASGGSAVIFFNAGLPNQTSKYRKDSHSGHFMIFPSAIAFGDNGEWAGTNEHRDSGSTFMGPALWLSDTSIFARVFQNPSIPGSPLGSHISMLHQSPYAMGIAHDSLKVYYIMDGYNGNICRYDFVQDHGPGYDDHSAGKIWRYTDVPVGRVINVPSHMVMDHASHWLYYIDGAAKEVRRLNTNTGTVTGNLTPPATGPETLAGYYQVEQADVEVIDNFSTQITSQPCGIDYYNNRLIVSDYGTGDLYLYNTTGGSVSFMGTISTGSPGIMGVKVGPDGKIWFVNNTQDKVYRLDITNPATDLSITAITFPEVENFTPKFYSAAFNLCDASVSPVIDISNSGTNQITSAILEYTMDAGAPVSYTWNGSLAAGASASVTLPASAIVAGSHLLSIKINSVNGVTDDIVSNNTIDGSFRTFDPAAPVPFTESFSASIFPPPGSQYIHFNPNNGMTHSNSGGFGQSTGSMKMDNYSGYMNITGQIDYLVLPLLDLSSLSIASGGYFRFDVAYAQYDTSSHDRLQVVASVDCGATWSVIYDKEGAALKSTYPVTFPYVPASGQWRTDSVSLLGLTGMPEVIFMLKSISNFGNNLFVDNIFVGNIASGIHDLNSEQNLTVTPNPVSDIAVVRLGATVTPSAKGEILSVEGRQVMTFDVLNSKEISLDVAKLSPGYYLIRITDGSSYFVKPLVKD